MNRKNTKHHYIKFILCHLKYNKPVLFALFSFCMTTTWAIKVSYLQTEWHVEK
jgi:hypothetical protein